MENLIEEGKKYTFESKAEEWVKMASQVSPEVLAITVKLMKQMQYSLPFHKINNEVNKIKDEPIKGQVISLLFEFGRLGPEFLYDRFKDRDGEVDRHSEIIQKILNKMDENTEHRGLEK